MSKNITMRSIPVLAISILVLLAVSLLSSTATSSVTGPDFTMNASPSSLTLRQGASASSNIVMASLNGFNGTVSLSTTPLPLCPSPQCPSWSVSPTTVTLNNNGTAIAIFTYTAGTQTGTGTSSVTVFGKSGSLSHSVNVTITVVSGAPDFTMAAFPSSLTITQGSSARSNIYLTSMNGFSGTINLRTSAPPTCPGCPTWSISPTSVTLASNGNTSATLTITASTALGNFTVTVYGTSGSLSHSTTVNFSVVSKPPPPPPDFAMTANPSSLVIPEGATGTSTVTVTSVNGFNGTVNLSTSPPPLCPACPTWGLSPSSVQLAPNSTASAKLTISAGSIQGNFTVTVYGTSGSLARSTTVTFTVVPPPPPPDFRIFANTTSLTIRSGGSATDLIILTSINNFSGVISLTATISPLINRGPTASLNPTSVSINPQTTGFSTLTVSTLRRTPTGTYTVTVTGVSGSISHSTTITLNVTR